VRDIIVSIGEFGLIAP